jgi:alkanesulfonate monooxygenase SsuD/methylene tetrahydromethanopterin reductase-like flavin-dependent oxidoreductase (luciferase family)
MTKHMHLNLFIHGRGHHEAAWRHPDASSLPLTDIRYYIDVTRKAEAGLFDSIFLADSLAVGEDVANAPRTWLEPITTLAALAGATARIGLIATCSTTYTEPFNLARQFASIDHMSNGRVGWNIVTTWLATASGNYGGQGPLSHAERRWPCCGVASRCSSARSVRSGGLGARGRSTRRMTHAWSA